MHQIMLFLAGSASAIIVMGIFAVRASVRAGKKANQEVETFNEQLKKEINAAYQRGVLDMHQKVRHLLNKDIRKKIETVFLHADHDEAIKIKTEKEIPGAFTKIQDSIFTERSGYYAVVERPFTKEENEADPLQQEIPY